MGCTVRLLEAPRCIELLYVGEVTDDDVRAGLAEGTRLAQEHHVWHVLTDTSELTSDPSVFALYDVAASVAAAGVAGIYREAVVAPRETPTLTSTRFYEDAMVNRSLTVRVFTDRAEAEAWLDEQPS
jgi:hypothetical protein